ncbi:N-acyl-D-glutamate amidohydrolase [Solimonas sp. K1W22B-7]|uniref:N-acyl-D-amino-acid deacylase family protein n=1 Tax=Solimonas sp. K1W22B-7 TaxID=2303331 RepID=UPI000E336934|nr:amidohydrolase family protein [Solimonas sp. K1W22B-7]AXQ30916.1 N-acyl-D-glutamate amidohydrolase [Solimonas sp. K1W22B-7]
MASFDVVIQNGLWFDGTGAAPAPRHLGIREGRVAAVSGEPLPTSGAEVIDARGQWVLPGFVDIHTHYDAEILVSPGLQESVRHGVTSIFLGSCSLSTVHADALDCADLFSRVEAIPREHMLAAVGGVKTWDTAAGYVRHLESLPLGPNVAAFLGHSDLRTHVMGLGRAVDDRVRPDEAELQQMSKLLEDALAAGFLGLSSMTTPWDKLDGERYRSRSLPSTYARWKEHRRLNRVLRRQGRVLQSAPNTTNPLNFFLFLLESCGFFIRKALRTSLLVAADSKAVPSGTVFALLGGVGFANRVLRSNLVWQHLPVPFQVYADGIDFVIFEEFGAGQAALHLKDEVQRNKLLQNEAYRRQFRRQLDGSFDLRLWTRDLHDTEIVACPDASVVGKSFGQVADERSIHPGDAFLDLVVAHGQQVRWRMTIANHRPQVLDRIASHPALQLGFADSGAHLRNMAFYNAPVRFLRRVQEAQRAGRPFMSLEQAVHRLTGELGAFYGVDAGTLRLGDRADVAIIDPAQLDTGVDAHHEAEMPEFGGMRRLVNRSGAAVSATLVGGQLVYRDGAFAPGYGEERRTGRFLRVGEPRGSVDAPPAAARYSEAA